MHVSRAVGAAAFVLFLAGAALAVPVDVDSGKKARQGVYKCVQL